MFALQAHRTYCPRISVMAAFAFDSHRANMAYSDNLDNLVGRRSWDIRNSGNLRVGNNFALD